MHHAGRFVITLALLVGCKEKTPPAPTVASGSATGAGSAMGSATGSAIAIDAAVAVEIDAAPAEPVAAPFPRFDDALAGKAPWITDDEAKVGIVELIAQEDLSDRKPSTYTTKRLCGAAAKKSVEAIGAAFVKRTKDPMNDAGQCIPNSDNKDKLTCVSTGIAEGDVTLYLEYQQTGGTWSPIGVQWISVGVNTEKQDPVYAKLLGDKCK